MKKSLGFQVMIDKRVNIFPYILIKAAQNSLHPYLNYHQEHFSENPVTGFDSKAIENVNPLDSVPSKAVI